MAPAPAHQPFCGRGGFSAVYGRFARGGMRELWERFPVRGLSVPEATKPCALPSASPRGEPGHSPSPSHRGPRVTPCPSAGLLPPGEPSKAMSLQNGRPCPPVQHGLIALLFHSGSSGPRGLWAAAGPDAKQGRRPTLLRRQAAGVDHRQSQWARGRAAWSCVTLASWATSLGRSPLSPSARLSPPTSQLWSHPAHRAKGPSGQSEHLSVLLGHRPPASHPVPATL